jgi:hypothetical protein
LVQHVLATHPLLTAARRGEAVLRAQLDPTSALYPQLRVRDNVRDLGDDLRVGLRWGLSRPGAADAEAHAGEATIRLNRAQVQLLEAQLAAQVRRAHLAWRQSALDLTLADAAQRSAETQAQFSQRSLTAGLISRVAVGRAVLETQLAVSARGAAEHGAHQAEATVRRWADGAAVQKAACQPAAPPSAHPALEAARATAAADLATTDAARREGWAWPTFLEVNWDREAEQDDRLLVGLGFSLGAPFKADAEPATRARAVARLAAVRREVQDAQAAAEAQLVAAQAAVAQQPDLTAARRLLAEARAANADPKARRGLARALARAEHDRASAQLALEAARITMQAVSGGR